MKLIWINYYEFFISCICIVAHHTLVLLLDIFLRLLLTVVFFINMERKRELLKGAK